jgi:hypothetical protein
VLEKIATGVGSCTTFVTAVYRGVMALDVCKFGHDHTLCKLSTAFLKVAGTVSRAAVKDLEYESMLLFLTQIIQSAMIFLIRSGDVKNVWLMVCMAS